MSLFEKLRMKRAKRYLKKALKIISKLSWEELDSLFPKPDYKYCFKFVNASLGNIKLTYPENTCKDLFKDIQRIEELKRQAEALGIEVNGELLNKYLGERKINEIF